MLYRNNSSASGALEDTQTLTLRGPGADALRCSRVAVSEKQAP